MSEKILIDFKKSLSTFLQLIAQVSFITFIYSYTHIYLFYSYFGFDVANFFAIEDYLATGVLKMHHLGKFLVAFFFLIFCNSYIPKLSLIIDEKFDLYKKKYEISAMKKRILNYSNHALIYVCYGVTGYLAIKMYDLILYFSL